MGFGTTTLMDVLFGEKFTGSFMDFKPKLSEKVIKEERIKHMYGVAELMYQYHDVFLCNKLSREELYVLGLNHDIGYIENKTEHEFYGARLFAGFCDGGPQNLIAKYIFHHGDTPKQYMEAHMCREEDIPRELILLWWADMNVESAGERAGEVVGFGDRLDSVKARYGEDSEAYRICKETVDWLISYMSRNFLTR